MWQSYAAVAASGPSRKRFQLAASSLRIWLGVHLKMPRKDLSVNLFAARQKACSRENCRRLPIAEWPHRAGNSRGFRWGGMTGEPAIDRSTRRLEKISSGRGKIAIEMPDPHPL